MTINKLNGTECGTEIAKKINDIIDEKASVSLDNLDTDGQAIIDSKVNSSDLFDANEHIKINKLQSYSLPSARYIDLTLGPSGTQYKYTAPADGWYFLRKIANNTSVADIKYCDMYNDTSLYADTNNGAYQFLLSCAVPVKKDDKIHISYNANGTTQGFRFVYAVGSAPQS